MMIGNENPKSMPGLTLVFLNTIFNYYQTKGNYSTKISYQCRIAHILKKLYFGINHLEHQLNMKPLSYAYHLVL
jgi:hypothetical protein